MIYERDIFKSGNSLVVGIPAEIVKQLGLRKGTTLFVTADLINNGFTAIKKREAQTPPALPLPFFQ